MAPFRDIVDCIKLSIRIRGIGDARGGGTYLIMAVNISVAQWIVVDIAIKVQTLRIS